MTSDNVPHITGECAKCHLCYDLKFTLECPRCHGTVLSWALNQDWVEEQNNPFPHILIESGNACRYDCIACQWLKQRRETRHKTEPEIAELYRMYALPDERSTIGELLPEADLRELERMFALEDPRVDQR